MNETGTDGYRHSLIFNKEILMLACCYPYKKIKRA